MFHARDGLFFERLSDGKVHVSVRSGPCQFDTVLPENEWGSVLATVSDRGEDYHTWMEARRFHTSVLRLRKEDI